MRFWPKYLGQVDDIRILAPFLIKSFGERQPMTLGDQGAIRRVGMASYAVRRRVALSRFFEFFFPFSVFFLKSDPNLLLLHHFFLKSFSKKPGLTLEVEHSDLWRWNGVVGTLLAW
jgi:hypothetical protein